MMLPCKQIKGKNKPVTLKYNNRDKNVNIAQKSTVAQFQVKGIEKCCRFVGSYKTLKSYISARQRFQKKPLNKKFAFYLNYKI